MISVVIPVYNESDMKMTKLAEEVNSFLRKGLDAEVVVSDDGSSNDCLNVFLEAVDVDFICQKKLVFMRNSHGGKWAAIRHGFLNSRGTRVFLLDADLAVGFVEVEKYLDFDGYLVGNRYAHVGTSYPLVRRFFSRSFYVFRVLLTGVSCVDSQCPFKLVKKEADSVLAFRRMREIGFIGDVELMMLLKDKYFREVPVRYVHGSGNFKISKNAFPMFLGLIRLCWRYRFGKGTRKE